MKTKTKNLGLLLLPNSFKLVGIGIILIALILGILYSPKLGFSLGNDSYASIFGSKTFFLNTMIVGLLCLVLAKDKIEDELTIKIRFQAMSFAFLTGAIQTVISPVINHFFSQSFDDKIEEYTASTTILGMLIMYLLMKTFLKSTR